MNELSSQGCCACPIFRLFALATQPDTYTCEVLEAHAPTLVSEMQILLITRCHKGVSCPMRYKQAPTASLYIDAFNSLANYSIVSGSWTPAQIKIFIQALAHLVDLVNDAPIRLQLVKNLA